MKDVGTSGRTVLFVSHHMAAVKKLCNNAILLNKGRIQTIGDADYIANIYNQASMDGSDENASGAEFPMVNHRFGIHLEAVTTRILLEEEHAHLRIDVG